MFSRVLLTRMAALQAVLCLSVSPKALSADYSWRSVAIRGGGYVSGVEYHPNAAGLAYCRTDVGGAYRRDTPGGVWKPLNDFVGGQNNEFMSLGVLSIGLDPADSQRVYLACGQYTASWAPAARFMSSSDRGATWTNNSLPFKLGGNEDGRGTGERIAVDPNNGQRIFIGTTIDGIWRSTNRGTSWSRLTNFTPTETTFVICDPLHANVIYAGAAQTDGPTLWRSTDGGDTWAAVPGQPSAVIAMQAVFDSTGVLYLTFCNALGPNGATSGSAWKMAAADTWANLNMPAGQGGFSGIALDPDLPGRIVISTLDRWYPRDQIYRSNDGGTSWTGILDGATQDRSSAPWATLTAHWISDVALDPFDSNYLSFVTGFGVFSTRNLGSTPTKPSWFFDNNGLEETVPRGLVSPASGPPLVSVIGDFDGFRHDNLDVPPATRHTPTHGTTHHLDGAGAASGVLVKMSGSIGSYTRNGASTWTDFPTVPPTGSAGQISVSADGTRFLWCPDDSKPWYSTNDGVTWTESIGIPLGDLKPAADRVNPINFAVYDPATRLVYVSTDGGVNFTPGDSSMPTNGSWLDPVPGLTGNYWHAAGSSGLWRSTDGALNFTQITAVQRAYKVGFGRSLIVGGHPAVYLYGRVANVDGIYRSTDTGATWQQINDANHQFGFINKITGDPRVYGRVYLATSGRGIIVGEAPPSQPTLLYRWEFDGATGVPTVQSGGGTVIAETSGATGFPSFAASGTSGIVGDNAISLSNDYTDNGSTTVNGDGNRATANSANALTGLGTLNSFTVTMWLNLGAGNVAGFPRFLEVGTATNPDNTNPGIYTSGRNTAGLIEFGVNGRSKNFNPGAAYGTGKWVFVAFTYDGTTAPTGSTTNEGFYGTLNNAVVLTGGTNTGVVVGDSLPLTLADNITSPGPTALGTAAILYLGNRQTGGRGVTGSMDDVRIYDGQMSVAALEAIRLESAPPPPAGGTPVYWKGTTGSNWTANNWTSDAAGTVQTPLLTDGSAAIHFAATGPLNLTNTILGANQSVRSLKFNAQSILGTAIGGTHNLTIGSPGVTLDSGAGQVTVNTSGQVILGANQTWTNNATTPFSISSQVAGAYALTTSGTGVTVLSGANLHTGGTTVDGGTLRLGNVLGLGPATTSLNIASGTLDLQGLSPTVASLTGSGTLTNTVSGTSTLTVNNSTDNSFFGPINNGSATQLVGLVKSGAGVLTLGGLGSFTGNIVVQLGTLRGTALLYGGNETSNFGNLQSAGRTITVQSGATLSLASNNVLANQYSNFANLPEIILNASTMTANNYNAVGRLTLNGASLLNTTAIVSTTYRAWQFKGDITAGGAAASSISNSGGKGNHLDTNTRFTVGAGSTLSVSAPLFDQSLDFTSAPAVPLNGGFSKYGPGTLTLTAANSYTGPTTVYEGALSLGSATSLSDTAPFTMADTTLSTLVLDFTGTDKVSQFVINGNPALTGTFGAIGSGAAHQYAWITGPGLISVPISDPFPAWIGTWYPVANDPNAAKSADPDSDGLTNLQEFAFNSLPNIGAASGKSRSGVETVGAGQALVITFPVRDGAIFSGTAPAMATPTADKITYGVHGSRDLGIFDQAVSEIPISSSGLPALDAGWSYRTFRLDGDVSAVNPQGFLRTSVLEAP